MVSEQVEIATKILAYLTALLAMGTFGVRLLVARQGEASGPARSDVAADVALRWSAALLLVALAARAWAHTAVAFGMSESFSLHHLWTVAIESRWGRGWQWQVASAMVLLVASVARRRSGGRLATVVGAAAAIAVCASLPTTGHAATEPNGWLVHTLHIVAAGLWAGTLAGIVLLHGSDSPEQQTGLLRAFAPVAAVSVAVLIATGTLASWHLVGTLQNLWTTEYGRTLSVKLTMVVAMLALGATNWYRLHRRGDQAVPSTVLVEVALAVAVVLVTGLLTETEHP